MRRDTSSIEVEIVYQRVIVEGYSLGVDEQLRFHGATLSGNAKG